MAAIGPTFLRMRLPRMVNRVLERLDASARDRIVALLLMVIGVAEVSVTNVHGPPVAIAAQSLIIAAATAWRRSAPLIALA